MSSPMTSPYTIEDAQETLEAFRQHYGKFSLPVKTASQLIEVMRRNEELEGPSGQDNAEASLEAAMEWIEQLTDRGYPAISKSIQKRVEAKGSQAQRSAEKDFAETFAKFKEVNDKRIAEIEAKGAK